VEVDEDEDDRVDDEDNQKDEFKFSPVELSISGGISNINSLSLYVRGGVL